MNKTVNNVFTENGMISPMIPATKNYHMNWDAIQAFQPEKAKVLEEYWDLIKKHPIKILLLCMIATQVKFILP